MKIETETRFNIGDLVYLPGFDGEEFRPRKKPFEVQSFWLYYDPNTQKVIVSYDLNDDLLGYSESACFASYEECEQWCRDRNNSKEDLL